MASLTKGGDDDVVWARDEIEAVTCKSGDAANQRRARRWAVPKRTVAALRSPVGLAQMHQNHQNCPRTAPGAVQALWAGQTVTGGNPEIRPIAVSPEVTSATKRRNLNSAKWIEMGSDGARDGRVGPKRRIRWSCEGLGGGSAVMSLGAFLWSRTRLHHTRSILGDKMFQNIF